MLTKKSSLALIIIIFSVICAFALFGSGITLAADTTKPKISSGSVDSTSGEIGDKFLIKAKVTDNVGVTKVYAKIVDQNGITFTNVTLLDDGKHKDGSSKDGVYARTWISSKAGAQEYNISIRAKDKAGNLAKKNDFATITLSLAADDDDTSDDDSTGDPGPIISGLNVTSQYGTVSFSCSTDRDAECHWDISDRAWDQMASRFCSTGSTYHYCSTQLSYGSYTMHVRCQDYYGKTNTKSATKSFTVQ